MRRHLPQIAILFLFFFMLFFPQAVFDGAYAGLLLWFETVLPTLLPFIMISGLLTATGTFSLLTPVTGPVSGWLFGTSREGSFAVLTGFLCGYPMGAKVTADLLKNGHISFQEASYLLSFCNNTSLGFIVNFVLIKSLGLSKGTGPAVAILFLSPVLSSFFFRIYYHRKFQVHSFKDHRILKRRPFLSLDFETLDHCIMDSFSTITNVGGYIIIFSVIVSLLGQFHAPVFLLAPLEITTGVHLLSVSGFSFPVRFVSCMALTSFGGICAAAQTSCMIQGTGLPLFPYIAEKLAAAGLTSLFSLIYLFYCV